MAINLEVDVSSAVCEYRPTADTVRAEAADHVSVAALLDADPYRTFNSYVGQRHYPGTYWAVTKGAFVIHESRLELASLQICDFDRAVHRIKAQPFRLAVNVDSHVRRHVPDLGLIGTVCVAMTLAALH